MIYDPLTKEEATKTNNVMLNGHTDFNSISTLVSQPVTALQVLMPDNVWRYVKHKDKALVINIGDQLSFMSGGVLKGTMHRGPYYISFFGIHSLMISFCMYLQWFVRPTTKHIFAALGFSISRISYPGFHWTFYLPRKCTGKDTRYSRGRFQQLTSKSLSLSYIGIEFQPADV